MSDKSWKATERAIAAHLGGVRVPVTGRARGSAPDVAHDHLAVEVKHRKRLPDWLHDAMQQAHASARGDQLPIVVLHEAGRRHAHDLVMVRMDSFRDWFGGVADE